MTNRLVAKYQKEVLPKLKKELGIKNDFAVPKIAKIIIAAGVTDEQHRHEAIKNMKEQMGLFTGQTPIITKAKKSIADFKLREGDAVGLKVTLRRLRMYEFFDKLVSIVLPKVKDFQGVSLKGFDGHGNYNLGLTEQIIFPEVEYDKIDKVRGLQISIVTSTPDDKQAKRLLELFGFPFEKNTEQQKKQSV
ncbi:MAG: 50S ribosomal protein L5 [Candidatus Chisholmbacteria bacterium]|nr:50S ribosomal protein L5 [Candidatus Chisholmbacteria bacterium]